MAVFTSNARVKADRVAATVGIVAFLLGAAAIVWGVVSPAGASPVTTTVVSSPLPGDPVRTTVRETTPPVNATREPRVTQDETIVEGGGAGTLTVTTAPPAASSPLLGSLAADVALQVILVALASFLLAFGTHRLLLGQYGLRLSAASGPPIAAVEEKDAVAIKRDIAAAKEAPDLSRPLFDRQPVSDPRMRLLQSRIALELEVRTLAQNHDVPGNLSIPYLVRGLVEKKRMSPQLASGITALHELGDRLAHGAELTLDTTTMLTDAYAQALAKVGGKLR